MTTEVRKQAFAEDYAPTWVDRFGVWLSGRQIRRWVPSFSGLRVTDVGCGYHASFARTLLDEAELLTLADVSLASDLKGHSRVRVLEGALPQTLSALQDQSQDVVMCVSVLEHLWEPEQALSEFQRILKPGGTMLINVPSWRGKACLEYSAFRLGLSPASEMNDHKTYYDPKDLWPMLVRAGFKPQRIRCFKHKFGLNTFAVCEKEK